MMKNRQKQKQKPNSLKYNMAFCIIFIPLDQEDYQEKKG